MADKEIEFYMLEPTYSGQVDQFLQAVVMRSSTWEFVQALEDTGNDAALTVIKTNLGIGEKSEETSRNVESDRIEPLTKYFGRGSRVSLDEFLNFLLPDICDHFTGVLPFLIYLKSKKVLTAYDCEEIQSEKTNLEKIAATFAIIGKKELHENIMDHLLAGLIRTGNASVIELMYTHMQKMATGL